MTSLLTPDILCRICRSSRIRLESMSFSSSMTTTVFAEALAVATLTKVETNFKWCSMVCTI